MHSFLPALLLLLLLPCMTFTAHAQPDPSHDLQFESLPVRWDEAVPLGNGILGALVWEKQGVVRISIDRSDLWDLRPIAEFSLPQFSFRWVREQAERRTYDTVQKLFDVPYEREPGPTRIPAGAIEFRGLNEGPVTSVRLSLSEARCEVCWTSGARLEVFVDASSERGCFRFTGLSHPAEVRLMPPPFGDQEKSLSRLGYPGATEVSLPGDRWFRQQGYAGFTYSAAVKWTTLQNGDLNGAWTVLPSGSSLDNAAAKKETDRILVPYDWEESLGSHRKEWTSFWSKSEVSIPDKVLEDQYYRDLYKFGSASRRGAPPITLQAVWTADNGQLPPWKGDFHNDLNTQLSYWPAYSSNHLEQAAVFTDWILANRDAARKYTRAYFGTGGLNYPGVSTLNGEPMGGWIQYAFGPTVSAWLSHHFYLEWKYGMDSLFLAEKAYPFITEVIRYLEEVSVPDGPHRRLPLSSSPEFNDNSVDAWFGSTTNFDLALIRWTYRAASEMAAALGRPEDAKRWQEGLESWPSLAVSDSSGLLIAPGIPYPYSHRHFSHLLAIHPLGLYDPRQDTSDMAVARNSIRTLQKFGPDYWCGYSYAWLGILQARAGNGEAAAEALRIFSECFCLPNSFHVNGDQSGTGKSKFTYRPFTLEGNFAFAAGIQEMLIQSQNGLVTLFPAIPASWKEVSFRDLRTEGAFLVSATRKDGIVAECRITAEKGGQLSMEDPFYPEPFTSAGGAATRSGNNRIVITMSPGQYVILKRKQ